MSEPTPRKRRRNRKFPFPTDLEREQTIIVTFEMPFYGRSRDVERYGDSIERHLRVGLHSDCRIVTLDAVDGRPKKRKARPELKDSKP